MTVRATVGGVPVEIWFTPSFNIKTGGDLDLEFQLRNLELEVYDLWELRTRKVKATGGEREAALVLSQLQRLLPELNIKITEAPELPQVAPEEQTEENPALH